jgi:hypothetical protein
MVTMSAKSIFARLCSDKRGGVAISIGILAAPIIGFAGVAIDYSRLTNAKTALQSVLDASLLVGIQSDGENDKKIKAAATAFAGSKTGNAAASFHANGAILSGQATTDLRLFLMPILGIDTGVVSVNSAVTIVGGGKPCIYVMEPTEQNSFVVNADSSIKSEKCSIHINSSNNQAAYLNSRSKVESLSTCIVGNQYLNSGSAFVPVAETACEAKPDPLGYLPEPAEATRGCDYTDVVVSSGQKRTLTPGVYCKKLEISSGGEAVFQPGIYVMRDGYLKVSSYGKATGSDMMIFFQGKDAYLDISSQSTTEFSARRSGTYAGIIIFQSRNPITKQSNPFIVNSESGSKLEGTVYMLNGKYRVNSQATSNSASYTAFVVGKMEINSLSNLLINSDYGGVVPLPDGLKGMGGTSKAVRFIK